MLALHDLVRVGKVRYLGASSMYAWQFSKAQYTAKMNGWTPFVCMQNFYNLLYREEEREMIPLLQDWGVGMIPWSPLARGVLTGKNRNTVREQTDKFLKVLSKNFDEALIDRCIDLAEKKKVTPSQVALAWIYSKPYVHSPIVGVSKTKYLDDLVGAFDVKLEAEDIKFLEELYVPKPVSGHT